MLVLLLGALLQLGAPGAHRLAAVVLHGDDQHVVPEDVGDHGGVVGGLDAVVPPAVAELVAVALDPGPLGLGLEAAQQRHDLGVEVAAQQLPHQLLVLRAHQLRHRVDVVGLLDEVGVVGAGRGEHGAVEEDVGADVGRLDARVLGLDVVDPLPVAEVVVVADERFAAQRALPVSLILDDPEASFDKNFRILSYWKIMI